MAFKVKIIPVLSFLFLILVLIVISCNAWVNQFSKRCYSDVESLPKKQVGLVLGTAKFLVSGGENPYYTNRIKAAVEVFNSGKIDYIIVSGDNATKAYNEPITMKNDLVANGIPEDKIYLDYAGFRTLDSVERAKEIFGQNSFIIISQQFHNERALAIAQSKGINAFAFNAKGVYGKKSFKTNLRELFARVKTVLDLTILQTKPKFYGEKIEIK